uniref:G-protein coupled receptors family 3 profile domain-containing protein n=1 Tax=Xenopus tropicalis TaxID=8364 RepID=A0A1B8Y8E3_XENTR
MGYIATLNTKGTDLRNYRYFLDLLFVIEEINNNPALLSNLTLGYHIYDSCGFEQKAVRSVLQILSGTREPISYGATDPSLSDRVAFPYFFRTVQSDHHHYFALSKLLRYFGWNWVGIITSDDDSGEKERELLTRYFSAHGICVEFTIKIMEINENHVNRTELYEQIIDESSANIIILCGTANIAFSTYLLSLTDRFSKKTLILTSKWESFTHVLEYCYKIFHGSLISSQHFIYPVSMYRFWQFAASRHPSNYPEDTLLKDIFMFYLCMPSNYKLHSFHSNLYPVQHHNCSGEELLTDIEGFNTTYHSPSVYLAVFTMFRGLQSLLSKQTVEKYTEGFSYRHQLHRYLRNVTLTDTENKTSYFDKNGEFVTLYEIQNIFLNDNKPLVLNPVGMYTPWAQPDQNLHITAELIIWKTPDNKIPRSQCSENCSPGYRKAPAPSVHSCCYSCVQCSEGEISNVTDSENCLRCPAIEWTNEWRNQCFAKTEDFLLHDTDAIVVVLSSLAVSLFVLTLFILGVFIKNQDTPIVRANNRSLSFLLLVSIKLSFLSVFLFLGRPVDITCMLRIITFGITFSIAVSSLLAKTIMVCVAFKATKPGSSWRKWLGVKLSNSVVLFCSSIQIIICMTWLAISPPFQELDIHTSPGTIIIQCNEGSAIGFYSVIGYMGLLAAVSFVLAFLARSLPDSFNEAKYITFSMLLFCSVWITMIPAYLSTKGKNTVCVEIFAILTSSAGLLACIFLPKCYIILFRPEINVKSHVFGKNM